MKYTTEAVQTHEHSDRERDVEDDKETKSDVVRQTASSTDIIQVSEAIQRFYLVARGAT